MAAVLSSVNYVILFTTRCSDGQYQCFDGSCIDLSKFCDFQNDCPDNSDEYLCCKYITHMFSRHLALSHFGLVFVLMLRPFFPWLEVPKDLLSFEHPSVLLFCLENNVNM